MPSDFTFPVFWGISWSELFSALPRWEFFLAKVISGDLEIITKIALTIIAFSIGGALEIKKLRSLKWPLQLITFLQAFAAALFVLILMSIFLPWLGSPQAK